MKFKACSTHQHEEEKYFCINLNCLTSKDAKLQCIECYQSHAFQKQNKLHQNQHFIYFIKNSEQNQNTFEKIQEDNAKLLDLYKKSIEDKIVKMKENFINQLDNLQKQITGILELEYKINLENIEKSSKLLKNVDDDCYLQNAIYFYTLDTDKLKFEIQESSENLERIINFHVDQLCYKSDEFCEQQFDTNFYKRSVNFSPDITTVQCYDVSIGQCQLHKIEGNYICIDELCQPQRSTQAQCTICLEKEHIQESKTHESRQFYDLREEQQQKMNKIFTEKFQLKQQLQSQMKEIFSIIKEKQYKSNNHFERMRKRIKDEYEKILLEYIEKKETYDYIIGDIDKNLLKTTFEDIEQKAHTYQISFNEVKRIIHIENEDKYQLQLKETNDAHEQMLRANEKAKLENEKTKIQMKEMERKLRDDKMQQTITSNQKSISTMQNSVKDLQTKFISEFENIKSEQQDLISQLKSALTKEIQQSNQNLSQTQMKNGDSTKIQIEEHNSKTNKVIEELRSEICELKNISPPRNSFQQFITPQPNLSKSPFPQANRDSQDGKK